MDSERKIELLDQQISKADGGHPEDFQRWLDETTVVMRQVLGADSETFRAFNDVYYIGGLYEESAQEKSRYQAEGVQRAISIMESAKVEIALQEEANAPAKPIEAAVGATGTDIFIVHGHDGERKQETARFLRALTGREPLILHEQADEGRVVIEKLEDVARTVGYAVVLLTGDDVGRAKTSEDDALRPRQNVVFEMGYFYGAIGRRRTSALLDHGVEKPGDVDGLVYIPIDAAGAWKMSLAKNIESAGIKVDWTALRS